MMEILGMSGAVKSTSVVGYASTAVGAVLATSVNADLLPVIFGAIGVGISLGWAILGGNRDRAREALAKQIETLQAMLDAKDQAWRVAVELKDTEREKIRGAKLALEEANERLAVRIARLEAEANDEHGHAAKPG